MDRAQVGAFHLWLSSVLASMMLVEVHWLNQDAGPEFGYFDIMKEHTIPMAHVSPYKRSNSDEDNGIGSICF